MNDLYGNFSVSNPLEKKRLQLIQLLLALDLLDQNSNTFSSFDKSLWSLPQFDFSQAYKLYMYNKNQLKTKQDISTATTTNTSIPAENKYSGYTGNGAAERVLHGLTTPDNNYQIETVTYSGPQAGKDNLVTATVGAGTNIMQTVNNIKAILEDFKNGKYDKVGDSGNEARLRAGAAMGATAVGATANAVSSYFDPGALNANDLRTEGMINAGLDVAALFGPYGLLVSGAGHAALAAANAYAKKEGNNVQVDTELMSQQGQAYEQTFADINKAANPGLKALFHKGRVKDLQNNAIYNQLLINSINNKYQDQMAAASYEGTGINNQATLNGGYKSLSVGKKGMKVERASNLFFNKESINWASQVIKALKGFKLDDFEAILPDTTDETNNIEPVKVPEILNYLNSFDKSTDKLQKDLELFTKAKEAGDIQIEKFGSAHLLKITNPDVYKALFGDTTPNYDLLGILKSLYPGLEILNSSDLDVEVDASLPLGTSTVLQQQPIISTTEETATSSKPASTETKPHEKVQILMNQSVDSDILLDILLNYPESDLDSQYLNTYYLLNNYLSSFDKEGSIDLNDLSNDISKQETPLTLALFRVIVDESSDDDVATILNKLRVNVPTIIDLNKDNTILFKQGGSFNVIPEGALHKNKHNMEDAEGLTKKGIPVITEEDGKKVLLAEIEVNEIIFRLEVTEKLEELAKEGTDEAAIEAGKLLVKEILHNTLDNTGLIKETI